MNAITPQYGALYSIFYACWDSCYGHPDSGSCYKVLTWKVSRVTPKRIYFVHHRYMEENEYFVERAAMERDGKVYHRGGPGFMATHMYLAPRSRRA